MSEELQQPQGEPRDAQVDAAQSNMLEDQPGFSEDMSYRDFLKLNNPQATDEEIDAVIRKETRSAWMVRFELLAALLLIIVIIVLIVTR